MDKVLADVHGDILFGKSLKFTSKLALDYSLGYDNIFTPKYYYSSENFAINDTSGVKLQNTFSKQYKYSFENYASYNNIFGDHSIELLAGMSYEKFVPNYLDVTSYNVPQGNLNYAYLYNTLNNDPKNIPIISGGLGVVQNNVANKDNPQQIITNYTELQNSYFGRIVYNYKEKYMLQGNIRRDGSNLLGPDNLYGIFPSFSLGWNISKEDFFADNISFINSMKIRFSWGQNGNKQVLTPFQYTSNMTNGYNTNIRYNYPNASHNLSSAIVPETPGNPTLKWETSQQSDLGVEMMMLKNKLVIGVDYFDKRTIDQLAIDAKVPLYLGFNSNPFTNNGEVQNKGVEFDITYRESESEFKYSVSINASYLKNKVLSYGSEGTFKEGAKIGPNSYVTRYEAGYPVYYFKGYQALGIFQDTLEIQSYLNASGAPLQKKAIPGDVKYLDANNDGKIDGSDALNYLGKPMPDWTYGLNLTCQYKGFDASAFFQGVKGNQIFFAALSARLMFNKPEYYFTERWNGPGTSNKYPRSSTGVATARGMTSANFNYSNLNVFDGDYLRLKNVTIGYTIPKDLTSKIGIGKLRFYFTATNLLTFTKYPGSDPEIGQVMSTNPSYFGIDRGLYPASKTYTGGLNVTF
jgi:TonB-linked SusC/RagA family outer membrane protein